MEAKALEKERFVNTIAASARKDINEALTTLNAALTSLNSLIYSITEVIFHN